MSNNHQESNGIKKLKIKEFECVLKHQESFNKFSQITGRFCIFSPIKQVSKKLNF